MILITVKHARRLDLLRVIKLIFLLKEFHMIILIFHIIVSIPMKSNLLIEVLSTLTSRSLRIEIILYLMMLWLMNVRLMCRMILTWRRRHHVMWVIGIRRWWIRIRRSLLYFFTICRIGWWMKVVVWRWIIILKLRMACTYILILWVWRLKMSVRRICPLLRHLIYLLACLVLIFFHLNIYT